LLTGIGDDAAVWQPSRSHRSVISTDAFVENVHFRRDRVSLEIAGRRAMAAALSDLAAMGARPVLATVSLALPVEHAERETLELYRGVAECAKANRCVIAGGDLSRAPLIALAITVVGEVRRSNLKLRSGARAGDVLAVTGLLGAARAAEFATAAQPRIAEGRWLAASRSVRAMMDLSDGLSTDLGRMCARSGCGALIERVPCAPGVAESEALAGGEDYELLAAIQPRAFNRLAELFRRRFGRDLQRVGIARERPGVFLLAAGSEREVAASGWDHFS
jgi:thiamine-monophosphate kinase